MEKTKYSRAKPNSNSIYLPTQPYRGSWMENSNTRKIPAPKKGKDIKHLTTKSTTESHKHLKPPTKTNMSGTNSHLLLSLNINGLNSPIKRQAKRWDTQSRSSILLHTRNTHQLLRQTLSQNKKMEKVLPSK